MGRTGLIAAGIVLGCSRATAPPDEFPCSQVAATYGTPTDSTGVGTAFTLTFSNGTSYVFSWATGSCVVTERP